MIIPVNIIKAVLVTLPLHCRNQHHWTDVIKTLLEVVCLPATHQVELTAIFKLAVVALRRKWHPVLLTILVVLTLLLILVIVVIVLLIILLIVIRCLFPNIKPVIASNVACLMFNARSLCNKLVELHYLLYSSKFDILLVTESWLHAGITNSLFDPESKFTVLRHDRSITLLAITGLIFRQTFSSTTWTVRQRLWSHPTCWRYINKSIIIIIIIITSGGGVCAFVGNSLHVMPVNLDNKYSILELLCFDLVAKNSCSPIRQWWAKVNLKRVNF